jgi:hypothetical protein
VGRCRAGSQPSSEACAPREVDREEKRRVIVANQESDKLAPAFLVFRSFRLGGAKPRYVEVGIAISYRIETLFLPPLGGKRVQRT